MTPTAESPTRFRPRLFALLGALLCLGAAVGALAAFDHRAAPPASAPLTPAFYPSVGPTGKIGQNLTSDTTAPAIAVSAGDALLLVVAFNLSNAQTLSSESDTSGDTFTLDGTATVAGTFLIDLFLCNSASAGASVTATATVSKKSNLHVYLQDIGHTHNPVFDAVGSGTTGTSTAPSDSVTSAHDGDLAWLFVVAMNNPTISASGASVLQASQSSTTSTGQAFKSGLLYQNQTFHGAVTLHAALSASKQWLALALAVRASTPDAPIFLSLSSTTTTSASLGWGLPSGTVTNGTVFYTQATSCGAYTNGGLDHAFAVAGAAASTTVTGLTLTGHNYVFEVVEYNASGVSPPSNCLAVAGYPAAPTGLSGSFGTATPTNIPLTWTNPAGTVVNDTVFYATGTTCSAPVYNHALSTAGAATSQTVSGLSPHANYIFAVEAWNATGGGALSACYLAPNTPLAPSGPYNPSAVSGTAISLSWTLALGTLTNITVYYSVGSSCPASSFTNAKSVGSGSATSTTVTGLVVNTTYVFGVQAWNATGGGLIGGAGGGCGIATTNGVPLPPHGLAPTAQGPTTLTFSWTNPAGTVVNDTLFWALGYSCSGAVFPNAVSTGGAATQASFTANVYDGYIAEVVAWNASGPSHPSACVVAPNVPPAPASVTATTTGPTAISVTWLNPNGALLNKTVFYRVGATCGAFTNAQNVAASGATSTSLTGLTTHTLYTVAVQEWNATGPGIVSACSSTTTGGLPPAPTGLGVLSQTSSTLILSWTQSAGGGIVNDTLFYDVGYSCSGPTFRHAVSTGGAATQASFAASRFVGYIAEVIGWNVSGASTASTCLLVGNLPSPPAGLHLTTRTSSTLTFGWTNPHGTVLNDTLFYGVGYACGGGAYPHAVATGGSAVTASFGGDRYTGFVAAVVAWNATGVSNLTACVLVTNQPPSPTSLSASVAANSTAVGLAWSNPAGTLTNDTVFYGSGSSCAALGSASDVTPAAGSLNLYGLTAGQAYAFEVVAWNASGVGNLSSCSTFTTTFVPPPPAGGGAIAFNAGLAGALLALFFFSAIGVLAAVVRRGGGKRPRSMDSRGYR